MIFYDGECGLCHGLVKFVLKHDKKTIFNFSPQQGRAAENLLGRDTLSKLPDSVWLFDTDKKIYLKSLAITSIANKLGGSWKILGYLISTMPLFFTNYLYDLIAENRHRIFKKTGTLCPLVTPEIKVRFLD